MTDSVSQFRKPEVDNYVWNERDRCRQLFERISVEQRAAEFAELFDEICFLLEQREAELMVRNNKTRLAKSGADIIAS